MSLTLGEKLREAREERGFTLSEVAEQTRISSLYLESIENDDYRLLPGGIFNKGFVKSFAKVVGVNEQEALEDYAALIAQTSTADEEEYKRYRPEVLTDDRSMGSMVPTIIIAVVILGLMSAGLLYLVDYMQKPVGEPLANSAPVTDSLPPKDNLANANAQIPSFTSPDMESVKVEFTALTQPVSLTVTNDGKTSSSVVTAGSSTTFEPKESLKLSYSRSLASVVQLKINEKLIALPSEPLVPRRNVIEFEINKDNLAQIWSVGAISSEVPTATPVSVPVSTPQSTPSTDNSSNSATPTSSPISVSTPATPRTAPRPTAAANSNTGSNTAAKPTPVRSPDANRRPANSQPKPSANDNLL